MKNIFKYSAVWVGLAFSSVFADLPEPFGIFVRQSFRQSVQIEMLDAHALTRILYQGTFSLMADPHPRLVWQEKPSGAAALEWTYYYEPRAKLRLFISARPPPEWTEASWLQWQNHLLAALPKGSRIEILRSPLEDNPMNGPIVGMGPVLCAAQIVIPEQPFAWICEEFWIQAPQGQGSWLLRLECPEQLYPVMRQEVVNMIRSWTIPE